MPQPFKWQEKEKRFIRDGLSLYGKLYLPDGCSEPYPLIIMAHGFGSCQEILIPRAEAYAAAGYAVCVFDFCGGSLLSLSDGETTEMSVMTEVEDLMAVFAGLRDVPASSNADLSFDPSRVYLWGESQGGLVAALAAAQLKDKVRGLILFYPGFQIPERGRQMFPDEKAVTETELFGVPLGCRYYLDIRDLDPYKVIGAYTGPVLLIHGDQDPIVPFAVSVRAAEEYVQADLHIIPGAGHGFFGETAAEADIEVLRFLDVDCRAR